MASFIVLLYELIWHPKVELKHSYLSSSQFACTFNNGIYKYRNIKDMVNGKQSEKMIDIHPMLNWLRSETKVFVILRSGPDNIM